MQKQNSENQLNKSAGDFEVPNENDVSGDKLNVSGNSPLQKENKNKQDSNLNKDKLISFDPQDQSQFQQQQQPNNRYNQPQQNMNPFAINQNIQPNQQQQQQNPRNFMNPNFQAPIPNSNIQMTQSLQHQRNPQVQNYPVNTMNYIYNNQNNQIINPVLYQNQLNYQQVRPKIQKSPLDNKIFWDWQRNYLNRLNQMNEKFSQQKQQEKNIKFLIRKEKKKSQKLKLEQKEIMKKFQELKIRCEKLNQWQQYIIIKNDSKEIPKNNQIDINKFEVEQPVNSKNIIYLCLRKIKNDWKGNKNQIGYLFSPLTKGYISQKINASLPLPNSEKDYGYIYQTNNQFFYTQTDNESETFYKLSNKQYKLEDGHQLLIGQNQQLQIKIETEGKKRTLIAQPIKQQYNLYKSLKQINFSYNKFANNGEYQLEVCKKDKQQRMDNVQDNQKYVLFTQESEGDDFYYQDNDPTFSSFLKIKHQKEFKLAAGQILKFGDDNYYQVLIGYIKKILHSAKLPACRICQREIKVIKYTEPCFHIYCCVNCQSSQVKCYMCQEQISAFKNIQ